MAQQKIKNTDVYENEDENIEVEFEFSLDKDGRCDNSHIIDIEYYVPACDSWLNAKMHNGGLWKAADRLIESWLEKNHYNETSEFRRRLDEENNCED